MTVVCTFFAPLIRYAFPFESTTSDGRLGPLTYYMHGPIFRHIHQSCRENRLGASKAVRWVRSKFQSSEISVSRSETLFQSQRFTDGPHGQRKECPTLTDSPAYASPVKQVWAELRCQDPCWTATNCLKVKTCCQARLCPPPLKNERCSRTEPQLTCLRFAATNF